MPCRSSFGKCTDDYTNSRPVTQCLRIGCHNDAWTDIIPVKVAPTRGLFNTREREGGYEKDLDLHHHNLRTGLSFDWIGMGTDGKGKRV